MPDVPIEKQDKRKKRLSINLVLVPKDQDWKKMKHMATSATYKTLPFKSPFSFYSGSTRGTSFGYNDDSTSYYISSFINQESCAVRPSIEVDNEFIVDTGFVSKLFSMLTVEVNSQTVSSNRNR